MKNDTFGGGAAGVTLWATKSYALIVLSQFTQCTLKEPAINAVFLRSLVCFRAFLWYDSIWMGVVPAGMYRGGVSR